MRPGEKAQITIIVRKEWLDETGCLKKLTGKSPEFQELTGPARGVAYRQYNCLRHAMELRALADAVKMQITKMHHEADNLWTSVANVTANLCIPKHLSATPLQDHLSSDGCEVEHIEKNEGDENADTNV